jgi:hypothetical protein
MVVVCRSGLVVLRKYEAQNEACLKWRRDSDTGMVNWLTITIGLSTSAVIDVHCLVLGVSSLLLGKCHTQDRTSGPKPFATARKTTRKRGKESCLPLATASTMPTTTNQSTSTLHHQPSDRSPLRQRRARAYRGYTLATTPVPSYERT